MSITFELFNIENPSGYEETVMKKKLFNIFLIVCIICMAVSLFVAMICGAPAESTHAWRYVICAAVVSVLLPAGLIFFFITTVNLSRRLEEQNEKSMAFSNIDEILRRNSYDIPVSVLVNALTKKRNLTKEEKKELLAYLEDFEDKS